MIHSVYLNAYYDINEINKEIIMIEITQANNKLYRVFKKK